ncbi:hypothetical protein BZ419_22455 [Salmonella enterica subsp. enterica serovar Enteritidis]|nr:hypothetical protein [Salmonella enterica subsp. enterica serovar Enteritidis]
MMKYKLFFAFVFMVLAGCVSKPNISSYDGTQGTIGKNSIQKMVYGVDIIFSKLHSRNTIFYIEDSHSDIANVFIESIKRKGFVVIVTNKEDKINYKKINMGIIVKKITPEIYSLSIITDKYRINQPYDYQLNKIGEVSIQNKTEDVNHG